MLLLIQYTLIFASVLILVALGGCISEHSGVINLGLEGIMVIGALGGALMMKYMPEGASPFVLIVCTVLMAIVAGVVYSSLLAVACINFKADQTIIGTALNMLGVAAATVIVKAINTAENPDNVSSEIQYIAQKKAFLVNIGSFEFNWFMLLALIALLLVAFMLYRTRFGLRLMACGEHPQAAASVGIDVYKMRWAGVLLSGGGHDFRSVEAQAHRMGGAPIRSVPCAVECILRLRLPCGYEHPERRVQHDALHHLAPCPRPHFEELPSSEGRRHPL